MFLIKPTAYVLCEVQRASTVLKYVFFDDLECATVGFIVTWFLLAGSDHDISLPLSPISLGDV